MPRSEDDSRIIPSVFDRLLNYNLDDARDSSISRMKMLRQLKQAVKRDLEWLFNTRQVMEAIPPDLKEVNNSLAAFGLPDFSNASLKNPSDERRLRRAIETAISTFEPRLEAVVVNVEAPRDGEQTMRFRISARLRVEPVPEPVSFDTAMQIGTGQFVMREE
jgi:type VI secretion system protein ImpF